MNSRERMLKTIKGEKTDRVPVTLFIQDHGHFIHQLHPEIDPLDYEALTFKVIDFQRKLGCDVFARMIFDLYHPINICLGGVNDGVETDSWKVETQVIEKDANHIKRSTITTPDGVLTQELTRSLQNKGTYVYACTKKPITTEEELDIAMKYEPGMSAEYGEMVKEKIRRVKAYIGDDGILGTWVSGGPFNNASMVFEHDNLYMLFMSDPAFFEKLMKYTTERTLDYTKAFIDAGADVMLVGGNVAGGFIGKDLYESFILPYEKRYIDFIQNTGTPAVYHNCGQIMNLIESYKKLEVQIVEPFSPVPLGDADLKKAKEIVNGDYVMIGGVDQVNVLKAGTVEEVIKVTKETMEHGKTGGKFIMQSVDFLEYGTPLENVEAFVKTALEHASYSE
jgi:uroporphyrinogen-III decarboxylase